MSSSDKTFSLRYFAGVSGQRKAFFEAKELYRIKPHPTLEKVLTNLPNTIIHGDNEDRNQVFLPAIKPAILILLEILGMHVLGALSVLLIVWIGSKYLEASTSLGVSLLICSFVVVLELIRERVFYQQLFLQGNLARVVQLSLFARVNKKLHTIDPDAGDDFSKGNLKVLIGSDIDNIEDFIAGVAWIWFPAISTLVVLAPFVIIKLGVLGVFGLATCFLQIIFSAIFGFSVERLQSRKQIQEDVLTTKIGEWVRNVRLARFLGIQNHLRAEVKLAVRRMTQWGLIKHVINSMSYAFSSSLWLLIVLVMLIASSYLKIPITLTTFFPSLWALTYIANYFEHVPYTLMMYGPALAGAKRVKKLLQAPELEDVLSKDQKQSLSNDEPVRIDFADVGLTIHGKVIFANLSLSLSLQQRTALIGSVGSGKSLLLSLLTGERAITTGKIWVTFASGYRESLWEEKVYRSMRELVAVSEQSPFLSSASLRDNIDLSDTRALEQVQKAVEEAEMVSDVAAFPHGLAEEVGEVGVNLSGGQKQRVSLARAFITDRKYFILDDPLSAVDSVTENKLFKTISGKGEGCLLVSHRLHELAACDRLLVLEEGKIVEDGDPKLLIEKQDSYFSEFIRRGVAQS